MRILGVDPGLTRCGIAVVDGTPRNASLLIADVIRTPTDLDLAKRLLRIETGLEEVIAKYHPDAVAVERVFAQHNLHSVIGTAQASGVALLVGARHSLPTACYTPSEVKAAISGSGRADKSQVGFMVSRVLKLDGPPKPADAADAVAVALCQMWRGGSKDRIAAALAKVPSSPLRQMKPSGAVTSVAASGYRSAKVTARRSK